MRIGIGNDHAATDLKFAIVEYLESKGYEVVNYGTDGHDSYDYPLAGQMVAQAIVNKEVDCGICICGTGIGISIAANKVKGIRAACCSEPVSAACLPISADASATRATRFLLSADCSLL